MERWLEIERRGRKVRKEKLNAGKDKWRWKDRRETKDKDGRKKRNKTERKKGGKGEMTFIKTDTDETK